MIMSILDWFKKVPFTDVRSKRNSKHIHDDVSLESVRPSHSMKVPIISFVLE